MHKEINDNLSRREFLAYGLSSAAIFSCRTDFLRPARNDERSLLLIQLSGGNDGFNTLIPYIDKAYYASRPNLALRGSELIKIDDRFAFNSSLLELAQLYRDGLVAVFPNVGCEENLTRSHMRASRIWETASPDERWKTSWYARSGIGAVSKIVLDGFDTHVDQKETHSDALRQLSRTLEKFRPQLKNTLVLVYSEFGRSLSENSTMGTDHGSTGLCLLLGQSVRGGIYPQTGSSITDFRSIYESIATGWFQSAWNDASLGSINFLTT